MIRFNCECGKALQAREEYAGQTTKCPDCGRLMTIPGGETAFQPAEAAPRERSRAMTAEEFDEIEARAPTETSGKATWSLVLGILSFICSVFASLPAVILAIMALKEISNSRGRLGGTGLAIGGLVTGAISTLLCLPILGVGMLLPATQKVREAANRMKSQNNLKQIALAFHNYHDVYGRFPPAVVYSQDGRPLYSWRVLLLPYLEQDALYRQFKLDEPWDSPHNRPLSQMILQVYQDPSMHMPPGHTSYLAIRGKGSLFESNPQNGLEPMRETKGAFAAKPQLKMADVVDGLSNTIMVVEAGKTVPWAAPDDLEYEQNGPLPQFATHRAGGFNAALGDGSVRVIMRTTPDPTLRAIITRNGGEAIQGGF
jgi:hypothetical protein